MPGRRHHEELDHGYLWISPRQALTAPLTAGSRDVWRAGPAGQKVFTALVGGAATIVLMIASLWAWRDGADLAQLMGVSQPEVVKWAVRCAALGAGAIAQAVLLTFVCGSLFRRDPLTDTLCVLASIVFLLSITAAVALALVGR